LSRREKLIRELIQLIEDNSVAWRKAAFYSDPRVEPVYDRLVREWESHDGEGIPLDYASTSELELLVSVAREYAFMDEAKARSLAMKRREETPSNRRGEKSGEKRGFFRIFRRKA